MNEKIKVGFCVAYDWPLLEYSLPLIYDKADIIGITIDKNRISWTGLTFPMDDMSFLNMIKKIDRDFKIKIWEENFFNPKLNAMENEVYQRNRMAQLLGKGGLHVQLDCDEYFLNFEGFINYIWRKGLFKEERLNICCPFVVLFRKLPEGFLVVSSGPEVNYEFVPVATSLPGYEFGRRNGYFNYHTKFFVLHQSWARSAEEVRQKVNNWGHKSDFDPSSYFEKWESANEINYSEFRNFHPLKPDAWPSLTFVPARDIDSLITYYNKSTPAISTMKLIIKNSRLISGIISKLNR